MPVFMHKIITCGSTFVSVSISALLVTLLGGCGLLGDSVTSAFVSPGKYDYYNCDQLAETGRSLSARERELVDLIARAGQGPAGEFVGNVAYRTDLMQARGSLKQVVEVSERKNCASQSKWQSDRALW
jgi:hypothetical protein